MQFDPPLNFDAEKDFPVWRLDAKEYPMRLYKISDEKYLVIQDGSQGCVLSNPLFVAINESILSVFQNSIPGKLKTKKINIHDRSLNQCIEGYHTIEADEIDTNLMAKVDTSGCKIWIDKRFGGLFVSKSLKEKIEEAGVNDTIFYPGYRGIGG